MAEQDQPPVEIIEEPSGTSDLPQGSPEEALRAQRAKKDLEKLQLENVADLIPVLKETVDSAIRRCESLREQMEKVLSQIMEIHSMMMDDAEAQHEILTVYRSSLVVLDKVENEGLLKGTLEKQAPKKHR